MLVCAWVCVRALMRWWGDARAAASRCPTVGEVIRNPLVRSIGGHPDYTRLLFQTT